MTKKADEKTSGFYQLVTNPAFYGRFQQFMGAENAKNRFVEEWLVPNENSDILDVGCGTANIIKYLTYRSYLGIDHNSAHISHARAEHYKDATFVVGTLPANTSLIKGLFHRIICTGFLHHLSDDKVVDLLAALKPKLADGGFVAIREPVFLKEQRLIARWMKKLDSGQHIRTIDGYRSLFVPSKFRVEDKISHDLSRLPYDHYWARLYA